MRLTLPGQIQFSWLYVKTILIVVVYEEEYFFHLGDRPYTLIFPTIVG